MLTRNRDENEGSADFWMGLAAGAVLGAALGVLFAPKSGAALRRQLSRQAGDLTDRASDGVRRASQTAGEWADRGRQLYDQTRDAVASGAEEVQRLAEDAAGGQRRD
jgi:gas vesicle protein